MVLDPTLKLEAVLAAGVATSQPEVHVDYEDWNLNGEKTKPAPFRVALNSSTDVTILAAPPTGFIRVPIGVVIYNKDTAAVTVTVKTDDGSTERIINKITLATLESLYYDDKGGGWYATTVAGARK